MEGNLGKAFREIKYQPEADLAEHIWQKVLLRNKGIANFKLAVFSFLSLTSLFGLIPAIKMLTGDITRSGFYEYLSLLFSDGGSLLSHWKEFLLSLVEALPLPSILLSLSLVFVFCLSIKYAMRQIPQGHLSASFRI